jgi:hypothetical protein
MKKVVLSLLCMCAVILAVAQMVVCLETNDNAVPSHFLETIVHKRGTTVTISLPPNNEIWYTSTTHDIISLENYPYKLVSNTYEDGIGKYKFDRPVVDIGCCFSDKGNPWSILQQFSSIILPASVISINEYFAMGKLSNVTDLVLPPGLISVGVDFVGGLGENHDYKHIYFTSKSAPYDISWRTIWNQSSVLYVHYPIGADYSSIQRELIEWQNEKPSFSYKMVPTDYRIH